MITSKFPEDNSSALRTKYGTNVRPLSNEIRIRQKLENLNGDRFTRRVDYKEQMVYDSKGSPIKVRKIVRIYRRCVPKNNDSKQSRADVVQATTMMTSLKKKLFKLVFVFVVLCIIHASVHRYSFYRFKTINVDGKTLLEKLNRYVIGQKDVIGKLVDDLDQLSENGTDLFIFSGGVGVGKSYIAKIIARELDPGSPHLTSLRERVGGCRRVVIVDDLTINDVSLVAGFLRETCSRIMILIFDLQKDLETSYEKLFFHDLELNFRLKEINLRYHSYFFNRLSKNDVVRCIKREMQALNVPYDETFVDLVLRNINHEYSGCKGVYSKVALLNQKLDRQISSENL